MLTKPVLHSRTATPIIAERPKISTNPFVSIDDQAYEPPQVMRSAKVKQTAKSAGKYAKPKTVLIDRASEALEKLTNAYRAVDISTLEFCKSIRSPTKKQHKALRLFVLFVNVFRDEDDKWPADYLANWSNMLTFITRSPSSKDMCLELHRLKKIVTRPHLANISEETYLELDTIRASFVIGQTVKQALRTLIHDKELKSLATLALTSINHLIPEVDEAEAEGPSGDNLNQDLNG